MARIAVAGAAGRVGRHVVDHHRYGQVHLMRSWALLPGSHATLAGPTFAQWLDATL